MLGCISLIQVPCWNTGKNKRTLVVMLYNIITTVSGHSSKWKWSWSKRGLSIK